MNGGTNEHWSSRWGFFLAALGSAVGLGNVWRFSFVAGDNGGGAFLLVYLLMVLLVGVPLLLAEFALGRSTQCEGASAVRTLAPSGPWRHLGLLGVVISTLVLCYYAVIAGWVFKYFSVYLGRTSTTLASPGYADAFAAHVAQPLEPVLWQGLALALTVGIIAKGIQRGIEKLNLLLMPLLGALLLVLAVHSATLDGFARGVRFLFTPDWAVLATPRVYLAAMGQAFFSIGLAMGVMVTFGSYLKPGQRLPRTAVAVALGDTLFAITAGLVIFPAVFTFGLNPAQGPGLAFVVLPEVFAQMRWGSVTGLLFFLLLSIAALTSMVSLLEVPVAYAVKRWQWSRRRASLWLGLAVFVFGVPASLGFGAWSHLTAWGNLNLLDAMDFVTVDVLLPLNGLLLSIVLGWVWPRAQSLPASDLPPGPVGRAWLWCLRYLIPGVLAVVLAVNLGSP